MRPVSSEFGYARASDGAYIGYRVDGEGPVDIVYQPDRPGGEDKRGGLTVSIGARVASHAQPSEVLVSQTVKDLVAGGGLGFEEAGEQELKGVPDRWRLYRVVP
jgi:hypothetical protein